MGFAVWFIAVFLGAIALSLVYTLVTTFLKLFRGVKPPEHHLTPKQIELNRRALIRRKVLANQELKASWDDRLRNLQMQAEKHRLEAQQEREKEN